MELQTTKSAILGVLYWLGLAIHEDSKHHYIPEVVDLGGMEGIVLTLPVAALVALVEELPGTREDKPN